jgi:hypothetical protein
MENQNVSEMSETEARQEKNRIRAAEINAAADTLIAAELAFGKILHTTHESGLSNPLTAQDAIDAGEARAKRDLRAAVKNAANLAANPDAEAIAKRRAVLVTALAAGRPVVRFK